MCLARSQAVSSEFLRQFSACRPFNRDLNSYFTVLTFTRGECVILFLVCCAFSVPRAPDYVLLTLYTQCVIPFLLSIYSCVDDHVFPASVHQSNFGNSQNKESFSIVDVSHRSKKASRSFEVYITS